MNRYDELTQFNSANQFDSSIRFNSTTHFNSMARVPHCGTQSGQKTFWGRENSNLSSQKSPVCFHHQRAITLSVDKFLCAPPALHT